MIAVGSVMFFSILLLPKGLLGEASALDLLRRQFGEAWGGGESAGRLAMSGAPILEFANLTRQFQGLVAVDSVTGHVNAHELVGLIGPNGAGKTTLFNLISGFIPPTEGEIRVRGALHRRHAAAPNCAPRHRPHLPELAHPSQHDGVRQRLDRGVGCLRRFGVAARWFPAAGPARGRSAN